MLIEVEHMEKVAGIKLPKDPTKWNQEILRYLFETHEWIDADNYHVKWSSNFEGERGYATGLVVLEKSGRSISIPVIVKGFELEPLDIFYAEDKLYPLTPKTIGRHLHNTDIAMAVDKNTATDLAMFDHIFPPHWGRYIHASVNPDRLCEALELRKEELDKVASLVERNAPRFFKKQAHIRYINKVLNRAPSKDDELEKTASVRRLTVEQDPQFGYRVGYVDTNGDYQEVRTGFGGLMKIARQAGMKQNELLDLVTEVDRGGVATYPMTKTAAITRAKLDEVQVTNINDDSLITTRTTAGKQVTGMVVPATYSFDLGRITKSKLLIDKDRNILAAGEQMAGIRQGKAPIHHLVNTTRVMPVRPGMVISFLWRNQGGTPAGGTAMMLATQPAKVLSVETFDKEGTVYTLLSAFGGRHRVMVLKGNRRPVFNTNNQHQAIYMPERTVILFGGKETDVVKTKDEFVRSIEKNAAAYELSHFRSTDEVMVKSASGEFAGRPFEVMAKLLDLGLPLGTVKEAMAYTTTLGSAKILADRADENTAITKEAEARLERLLDEIHHVVDGVDLVKAASYVEDVDTADKVLALNFVNRKNLMTFYRTLPKFKEAASDLARLLLAARLGKVGVNQAAILEAMNALQSFIEKMEGLHIDENRG